MLDAVESMVHEGPGQSHFDAALDQERQTREGGGDAEALQVPAGEGRHQVADAVGVERAGEEHAREPLPDGAAEVRLLLVVDLEVRRHGPPKPLRGED